METIYEDVAVTAKRNQILFGRVPRTTGDVPSSSDNFHKVGEEPNFSPCCDKGGRECPREGGFHEAQYQEGGSGNCDGIRDKTTPHCPDAQAQIMDRNFCSQYYGRLFATGDEVARVTGPRFHGSRSEDEPTVSEPVHEPAWLACIIDGYHPPKVPEYLVDLPVGYTLHAPRMNVVNMEEVEMMWKTAGLHARWEVVVHALSPSERPPLAPSHTRRPSELSASVVQGLLDGDVIEEVAEDATDKREGYPTASVWLRAEPSRKRCRVITWPRVLNEWVYASGYTPDVPLKDAVDMFQFVHFGAYCFTADVKCSFFQWPLFSRSKKWYRLYIRIDGRTRIFTQKRMCMGHVASPEMLNSSLRAAIYDASRFRIFGYIHIDNLILIGCKEDVERYVPIVLSRLNKMNIVLGEQAFGETASFCGIRFNFVQKTVQLGEKGIKKLQYLLRSLTASISIRDYIKAVGVINFYSRVLFYYSSVYFSCDYFDVVQHLRGIARCLSSGEVQLDTVITFPALYRFKTWATRLFKSDPVMVPNLNGPISVIYITDASEEFGIAGAIIRRERIAIRWLRKKCTNGINALELQALVATIQADSLDYQEGHELAMWIGDNQSDLWIMRRKTCRSSAINNPLMRVLRVMAKYSRVFKCIEYIPSKSNPVDARSRGMHTPKWAIKYIQSIYQKYFPSERTPTIEENDEF